MEISGTQRFRVPFQTLVAASVIAFVLAACGEKSPPPRTPQPASPVPAAPAAPQAQAQPAPAQEAAPEAAAEEKPDPDKALAKAVQGSLRESLGSLADNIDVTASHGKVTLWGTVPEAAERVQAVRTATGVAGVKSVKDNMAIVSGS